MDQLPLGHADTAAVLEDRLVTEAQLTPADGVRARRRYEPLLSERMLLGRLLADALSHLADLTPEALRVFDRLLGVDAELATFRRYDRDLFDRVLPVEDARVHHPPSVPADHHEAPCAHCLRASLGLGPGIVLPPQARRSK